MSQQDKSSQLKITVEFGGGTELLFDNQKQIPLSLDTKECEWTVGDLIQLLSDKYVKDRLEMFSTAPKKIRPGILILVNEVDYELLGGDTYKLKADDKILFISTLHGG